MKNKKMSYSGVNENRKGFKGNNLVNSNKKEGEMVSKDTKDFFRILFFMIVIFAFGGAGLGILFNSKGDLVSIIGGFVLIGIAVAGIYKLIQNE